MPGVVSSGWASGFGPGDLPDNWGPGVGQSWPGTVTTRFSGAASGARDCSALQPEEVDASPDSGLGPGLGPCLVSLRAAQGMILG